MLRGAPGAEIIRAGTCGSSPSAAEMSGRAWAAVLPSDLRAARRAAVRLFRNAAVWLVRPPAAGVLPEPGP